MNSAQSLWTAAARICAAVCVAGTAPLFGQTIPNPSFEADRFTVFPGYVSANGPITGWTASPADRVGLNPAAGSPFADNGVVPHGTNVAFIQSAPGANSSLRTTIADLVPGTKYTVNFRLNARGTQVPSLKVGIDDQPIVNMSTTGVGGTAAYRFAAFDFTAAGTTAALSFTNDAAGDTTVAFDNLTINVSTSRWSYAAWQNDSTSGVDGSSTYTHAYNFGPSVVDTTINGVTFRGLSGGNPIVANEFSISGVGSVIGNDDANSVVSSGGGSAALARRFIYGGNSGSYYIGNLVPGMEYEATFYAVAWEAGIRSLTFTAGSDRMTINQDHFGDNQGIRISYRYIAPASGAMTLLSTPTLPVSTLHLYGFSNREVNQQPNPTIGIQPRNQVSTPGSTVNFSVVAGGQRPLFFQWLKDGAELSGQTNRFLTISNFSNADLAGYSVVVSNVNAAVTSDVATVTFGNIANPSFEVDVFHTFPGYVSNNRPISGWHGAGANRVGINPHGDDAPFANNGVVPDGRQVGFIQSGNPTNWLSTILNGLTPGEKYSLTFRVNARNGQTATIRAAIDNQTVLDFRANSTGGTNAYRTVKLDFTAASASPLFSLTNETAGDHTLLIDDFKIAPTPATTWAVAPWTNDLSAGIDTSKFYTHAFNFGPAATDTTINGVTFRGIPGANPAVAGQFSSAGLGSTFPGPDVNAVTLSGEPSGKLAEQFIYGGPIQSFTLTNLVPGMEYVATIYTVGFDAKNYGRTALFSAGSDRLFVNQNEFGNDVGLRISHRYVADANGAVTLSVQPSDSASSIHVYALANYAVADSAPMISVQPQSAFLPIDDVATLFVALNAGSQPTFYQWQKDGVDILDQTNATLVLNNLNSIGTSQYRIIITNAFGAVTSTVASVEVGARIAEVFSTGVDNTGALLGDNAVDPHYTVIYSDDPARPGPNAFTMVDNQYPIVAGTYLTNGPRSRWITASTNGPAGNYIYRTSFILDTVDPAQSQINGMWASDNDGLDIRLNGVSLGISNIAVRPFADFVKFTISSGFVAGSNTLDFVITNLPPTGFTAFRAELVGVGRPLAPSIPQIVTQPVNTLAQQASNVTFTVVASGSPALSYQWYYWGIALPNETNRILRLSNVSQFDQEGEYKVEVSNSEGATFSDTIYLTINAAPEAGPDSIASGLSTPVSIPAAKFLHNDGDVDGDTLSIVAVSATSTNGGTVSLSGGMITYIPVASFVGADQFTYTLGDSRGGRAIGVVNVNVGSTQFLSVTNGPALLPGGAFQVGYLGVPGYPYTIERATSVLGPWEVIGTVVADENGLILVNDPDTGAAPTRFYRTMYP